MLVGPGGVETRGVRHAEARVTAHALPGVHRGAIVVWVANQLQRIDGVDSAVAVGGADAVDPVYELLILVDTFFVLGYSAVRYTRSEGADRTSISSSTRLRSV